MRICFAVLLTLFSFSLQADLIVGELRFDGAPPAAAVIFVRDAEARISELTIDQKNRQFDRFMAAASQDAEIQFHNSDSARHNLYANSYSTGTRFDVGLVPPGQTIKLKLSWPEDSIVRIGCAIHSHMETYIAHIRATHYQVLPFKHWEIVSSGGMDDYDAGASNNDDFEETISKEADIRLRAVPSDKTSLTLLIPYYPALNFDLKAGESKTIDVLRDGSKRGTLTVKRS